jgi:metallo-beta-lactamase family protein
LSADISATFKHAGHILGAAQLLLEVNKKKVFFSGDLGRAKDALMKPPAAFEGSDILITESTYGNRTHPETNPEQELAEVLGRVIKRGGTAIIPAFAVGRTQALLLHIYRIMKSGQIPTVPVYLNSPMANKVTDLYEKHREEHKLEIDEFNAMYDIVKMVKTVDESKELNTDDTSKIIIAASGMLTGGRVLHHVKRFGRDSMNAILIVGYQAGGTRGRALIDGAKSLRIFGSDVPIRAEVVQIDSLSAHMDSAELLAWMKSAKNPPAMTYLTHGEPEASDQLRIQVDHQLNWPVRVATMGEVIDLDNPK